MAINKPTAIPADDNKPYIRNKKPNEQKETANRDKQKQWVPWKCNF